MRLLVDELIRLYGDKRDLLDVMLLSESDKCFYAESGNMDRVEEALSQDEDIIARINEIDCDIAEAERKIALLAGVPVNRLYRRLSNHAPVLLELRRDLRSRLAAVIAKRDELTKWFRRSLDETARAADELRRLDHLHRSLKGHPINKA